jgi:hypothetical protein
MFPGGNAITVTPSLKVFYARLQPGLIFTSGVPIPYDVYVDDQPAEQTSGDEIVTMLVLLVLEVTHK